jgi:hypothetical protein
VGTRLASISVFQGQYFQHLRRLPHGGGSDSCRLGDNCPRALVADLTIARSYIPGYFPRKNSTMSMLSPIPCAMIGTARLRPVRK